MNLDLNLKDGEVPGPYARVCISLGYVNTYIPYVLFILCGAVDGYV